MKRFILLSVLAVVGMVNVTAQEMYAVYKSDTLTFYYDYLKESRDGTKYRLRESSDQLWQADGIQKTVTTATFDSSFDNARPTGLYKLFDGMEKLKSIEGMQYLHTDNFTTMENMFSGCKALTSLDLSSFNTENVTDMRRMFYFCASLTSLDLSSFNTEKVEYMHSMFGYCESLTSLDLSSFNTENVTTMNYMFFSCKALTSLDLSSFTTEKVEYMHSMFYDCKALTSLDLSSFNTENVTDMNCMFFGCKALTSLDLTSFNTKNVTDMNRMFNTCESLTSLDLSSFTNENVTNMELMFSYCTSLTSLDLTSFNTENVTNMYRMFYSCESLTSLDLSSFNTENVTNMHAMFYMCGKLTTIYAENDWKTDNVTNSQFMFSHCDGLVGGAGTKYSGSHIDATYARIDGGSSAPGYFTRARSLGFSINGKEMTTANMDNVPGVKSGKAYITLDASDNPTLVLDNATIDTEKGIYNATCWLDVKVIGNCTIISREAYKPTLELDPGARVWVTGGGTLTLENASQVFGNAVYLSDVSSLRLREGATVIARTNSHGSGLYDCGDGLLDIDKGCTFCAYSLTADPFSPGNITLGEGISLVYPIGGYYEKYSYRYADGTVIKGDWVVFGPESLNTKLGFSIDGKEMTILDTRDYLNDVPGVKSGNAYITLDASDNPTLVLDNATLEWDTNNYGLYNHDTGQDGLTIKVLGDCTIKAPNAFAAHEIEIARTTTVEGGGTLNIISDKYPIRTWVASTLRIQDGTTVIAKSEKAYSAFYDEDGAYIEIRNGGVFAAYGTVTPIWLDPNGKFVLGEGIALRYPFGAYIGSGNNIYNADGTEVKGDWVVFGPDNQKTQDLITGIDNVNANVNANANEGAIYNLAGQRFDKMQKGVNIIRQSDGSSRKILVR